MSLIFLICLILWPSISHSLLICATTVDLLFHGEPRIMKSIFRHFNHEDPSTMRSIQLLHLSPIYEFSKFHDYTLRSSPRRMEEVVASVLRSSSLATSIFTLPMILYNVCLLPIILRHCPDFVPHIKRSFEVRGEDISISFMGIYRNGHEFMSYISQFTHRPFLMRYDGWQVDVFSALPMIMTLDFVMALGPTVSSCLMTKVLKKFSVPSLLESLVPVDRRNINWFILIKVFFAQTKETVDSCAKLLNGLNVEGIRFLRKISRFSRWPMPADGMDIIRVSSQLQWFVEPHLNNIMHSMIVLEVLQSVTNLKRWDPNPDDQYPMLKTINSVLGCIEMSTCSLGSVRRLFHACEIYAVEDVLSYPELMKWAMHLHLLTNRDLLVRKTQLEATRQKMRYNNRLNFLNLPLGDPRPVDELDHTWSLGESSSISWNPFWYAYAVKTSRRITQSIHMAISDLAEDLITQNWIFKREKNHPTNFCWNRFMHRWELRAILRLVQLNLLLGLTMNLSFIPFWILTSKHAFRLSVCPVSWKAEDSIDVRCADERIQWFVEDIGKLEEFFGLSWYSLHSMVHRSGSGEAESISALSSLSLDD